MCFWLAERQVCRASRWGSGIPGPQVQWNCYRFFAYPFHYASNPCYCRTEHQKRIDLTDRRAGPIRGNRQGPPWHPAVQINV
jgi:hypothetical protein